MNNETFLMWYDDKPKTSIDTKIADALQAFRERFHTDASVALISTDEMPAMAIKGVSIRVMQTVRRNTVWVGMRDV